MDSHQSVLQPLESFSSARPMNIPIKVDGQQNILDNLKVRS